MIESINQFMSQSFTVHQLCGYIGSFLLAVCGLPECIRSIKDKRTHVGWGMLLSWGIGEVLVLVYILPKQDIPLIINYSINLLFIIIMAWYKCLPAKKS